MSKEDPTEIDLYNLDKEWEIQPRLRKDAGVEQADKAEELRDKKAYAKYRKAQIALEYRTNRKVALDKDDKTIKLTEGALNDLLDSDEELYELEKEINKLQKDLDVCSAYTEAINAKKYGLQDAVKLWLSDYFSEPVDPSSGGDYKEKVERVRKKMDRESEIEETKRSRRRRQLEEEESDV